jgi:hypothetical protein
MASRNIDRIVLSLVLIVLTVTIATQGRYTIQAIGQGEERQQQQQQSMLNDAPKVTCIYQGKKYSTLTPFFLRDGQGSVESGFPKLPDNIQPEMIVQDGRTITMEFEENPTRVEAFLADYDADVAVRYPLEKVRENTFKLTPEGTKTLEVRATFPDNEQVMYSTLVDVRSM